MAHGALIENMLITATALGYRTSLSPFPDRNNPNLCAVVGLEKSEKKSESLYPFIKSRATNRKPFKEQPLTPEQKTKILESTEELGFGEVRILDKPSELALAGEAVSANEIIMFENKIMHKLFFKEIVWSEQEEKDKKSGLYVRTLEMKPQQESALKLFKFWPVMNFFNKLGLARSIARENAKNYARAAAFGAIIVGDRDEDFFKAGRLLERIWLKATEMNLGFQVITGIPFMWQRISAGLKSEFSKKHLELIDTSYKKLTSLFGVKEGLISLTFRIGEDSEPGARSSRLPPQVLEIF